MAFYNEEERDILDSLGFPLYQLDMAPGKTCPLVALSIPG